MHHPLSPSGAARRNACTGSVGLQLAYPEAEESQASRDGTAAHWVARELWEGRAVTPGLTTAPNGVVVDEEMLEAAELYVGHLRHLVGDFPLDEVHLEERLALDAIYPGDFGTPDFWFFRPAVIYLRDFKYGHGYVEVYENDQLVDYLAGIVAKLGIDGYASKHVDVDFGIVQPRSFHPDGPIRTWRVPLDHLRAHINRSSSLAHEAMGPNAKYSPGPHCGHCSGRHACPTLQAHSYRVADLATARPPVTLPPEALGLELRTLKNAAAMLEARVTGLEAQALALERQGVDVPFFRAEQGEGRERWVDGKVSEVLALGDLLGKDLRKPDAIVTPRQARKIGVDASVISAYVEKPRGEWKLVEDTITKAAKVFKP